MKKPLRYGLYALASLVLLYFAALVIVKLVLDPNQYKGQISTQVQQHTGWDVVLAGPLSLDIFPTLRLVVRDVHVRNPPGFDQPDLAHLEVARAGIALWPLLSKQLEVEQVVVEGIRLNLLRSPSGVENWRPPVARKEHPDSPAQKPDTADTETQDFKVPDIELAGIEVHNASVRWNDLKSKQSFAIDDLHLSVGRVNMVDPTPFDLATQVQLGADAKPVPLSLAATVHPDFDRLQLKLDEILFKMSKLRVKGKILVSELNDVPKIDASLRVEPFAPGPWAQSLGIKLSENLHQMLSQDAELQLRVVGDQNQMKVDPFQTRLGDLKVSFAQAVVRPESTDKLFSGQLEIKPFSPRAYLKQAGIKLPELQAPDTLNKFQLTTNMQATASRLSMFKIQLGVDETKITGHLAIRDFKQPDIFFNLSGDRLDLDRYRPKASDKPTQKPTGIAPSAGTIELPAFLDQLVLNGKIELNQLVAWGVQAQQVKASLTANNGVLRASPITAKMYKGSYQADFKLKTGKPARYQAKQKFTSIEIEPLLQDTLDKSLLSGRGNLTMDLNSEGNDFQSLQQTLAGAMDFEFLNGAIKGINVAQMIRSAEAAFSGQQSQAKVAEETDFTSLRGNAKINKGVLSGDSLNLQSPLLRVTGNGNVDLVGLKVDYLLKTVLVGTLEGQGGRDLSKLKGIPLPIKVKGDLLSPKFSLDLKQAITETQKARLKEKQKEVEKKFEDKAAKELEKGLKKLFR